MYHGEPILLLYQTRKGKESAIGLVRLEEKDGRLARLRSYGFCPRPCGPRTRDPQLGRGQEAREVTAYLRLVACERMRAAATKSSGDGRRPYTAPPSV